MRIIFLNAWYAKTGEIFFEFVKSHLVDTNIFCFQEVDPKLFNSLSLLLAKHLGKYSSDNKIEKLGYIYGQAIFVNKNICINKLKKLDLYRNVYNDVGFLQSVELLVDGKTIHLGNLHAKARPGHKVDTPARLKQSEKIIDFFAAKQGPKIIGGDFNLMPKTKSIKMFEEAGYRNLIKEYKILFTRNRLSWEQYPEEEKQYYADYVFVSPEVKVRSFAVPDVEISDHLPLILDFEI